MRAITGLLAGFGLVLATGCESVSDATASVREKFAERAAPQTRSYPAAQRTVYEAVRVAAGQMGYQVTRGAAAQGIIEAVSRVRGGDAVGSARQVALKVKLENALDGGTSVAVRFTEILEADSSNRTGVATEVPLRDTPQYEVFFRAVEAALRAPRE